MCEELLKKVADQLAVDGYDGLYYPGECACLIGDLAPCGECHHDDGEDYINGCEGGYKHMDPRPSQAKSVDWIISAQKDPGKIDWEKW